MNEHLHNSIVSVWSNQIKGSYDKGLLCSERQLQAELYHHLKNSLDDGYQLWVEPTLELENEAEKWKIKPDILITKVDSIEAIIEIKNVPYGEAVFSKDIEKMVHFQKSNGRTFHLETDPATGLYKTDRHFYVADDIICVYAAIAKGDHAWAVETKNYWNQQGLKFEEPKNFLHLVGRIFVGKDNYFGVAE